MFLLVVKSVARWVCDVPDGPQMGGIPSLALDKVPGGVRDDTDRKFRFRLLYLCMKLEAEENAFVLSVKGIAG